MELTMAVDIIHWIRSGWGMERVMQQFGCSHQFRLRGFNIIWIENKPHDSMKLSHFLHTRNRQRSLENTYLARWDCPVSWSPAIYTDSHSNFHYSLAQFCVLEIRRMRDVATAQFPFAHPARCRRSTSCHRSASSCCQPDCESVWHTLESVDWCLRSRELFSAPFRRQYRN